MLVLAIDTTTAACSVALVKDGELLAEQTTNIPRTHSGRLLPLVDQNCREAGVRPRDLELVAVSRGPGSFTGLRIGIATAKALGLALDIPVVGLSTLEVLAHNVAGAGLVCPVLNARRDQVYTALFRVGSVRPERLLAETAMPISQLIEYLKQYVEPVWFCGDGVHLLAQPAQNLPGARFLPLHQRINRAGSLADLALLEYDLGGAVVADQLVPLYLRESQAEVMLRQRQEEEKCRS